MKYRFNKNNKKHHQEIKAKKIKNSCTELFKFTGT